MRSVITFISILFIGWNASAQENILPVIQSHRSDIFKLDSLYLWGWDTLSDEWILENRTSYIYDENQNITNETQSEIDITQVWTDLNRSLNTYDAENRLTNIIDQKWEANAWVNTDQLVYTYDVNGDQVGQLFQNWDGTSFVDYFRQVFTYDNNHNLLTRVSQAWNGTTWNNGTQQISTYDANNRLTVRLNQSWNGSWSDVSRSLYTYDVNNDLDTLLYQKWSFNAWNDDYRNLYDFDAHHNRTLIQEQLAVGIGVWEDREKYEYTYDQFDKVTNLINSEYTNGAWVPVYQYNIINDEDQNRSSEVFQNWENGWVNQDSTQYYYTNLTGVHEIPNPHSILISPNPANDQLNISFEHEFEGRISVYTLQGMKVIDRKVAGETVAMHVDIASWQPGQYVIVLRNENGIVAKAFQKL